MQFVAFANNGQCVFLFKDFEYNFKLIVGGRFALGLTFLTGLKLARYLN